MDKIVKFLTAKDISCTLINSFYIPQHSSRYPCLIEVYYLDIDLEIYYKRSGRREYTLYEDGRPVNVRFSEKAFIAEVLKSFI